MTAPAQKARAESDELTEASQQGMQEKLSRVFRLFMIFFAIVGIAVIMLSFAVSGTITRPIQRLTASVHDIGKGNFEIKIPVESGDEVGELAGRFNEMQDNLKECMENIKMVTAENERIGAELNVATQIQAANRDNELLGNDRLLESLNKDPNASPEELLETLRKDIDEFVGTAPQFDDITMLGFRFYGDSTDDNAEKGDQL